MLRPLPEVDENELHCIIEPVYLVQQGQTVIAQQPLQTTTSNLGYANTANVQQGSGMVREEGYVEKTTTIKETIKLPTVM